MIRIEIPIEAQPVQTGGKRMFVGKTGKPVFFKDARTRRYLEAIRLHANRYRPAQPLSGALEIKVLYVMPRPQRLNRKKDPEGRIWMDVRPDWDNLQKGTQDALDGFWGDDGQIALATVMKVYAAKGELPSIQILINQINESLSPPHRRLPAGHGSPDPS